MAFKGYYQYFDCTTQSNRDKMQLRLVVNTVSQNKDTNTSTINVALEIMFTTNTSQYYWTTSGNTVYVGFNINGSIYGENKKLNFKDYERDKWHGIYYRTGISIAHTSNGTKSINVSTKINNDGNSYMTGGNYGGDPGEIRLNQTCTLPPIPRYTLSITQGANSTINVDRISTAANSDLTTLINGKLHDGSNLTYGDVLKITFTPDPNYTLSQHTVNNSTFTSGNQMTVNGATSVVSSAVPNTSYVPSMVQANDIAFGSRTTTFTITKSNSNFTTSISLESSDGGWNKSLLDKSSDSSYSYTFSQNDISFLTNIANQLNQQFVRINIKCTTYNGNTIVKNGSSDYTTSSFKVYVIDSVAHSITCNIVDKNTYSSTLIREITFPKVTISNLSSFSNISRIYISNGSNVTESDKLSLSYPILTPLTSYSRMFTDAVVDNIFTVKIIHSGGTYIESFSSNNFINYRKPTLNIRYVPGGISGTTSTKTGGILKISGTFFNGTMENGSNNSITLKYRYAEVSNSYPTSYTTISSMSVTKVNNNFTVADITINNFDVGKIYKIEVVVTDSKDVLSKETETSSAAPVFDFDGDDFEFNVPVTFNSNPFYIKDYDSNMSFPICLNYNSSSGSYAQQLILINFNNETKSLISFDSNGNMYFNSVGDGTFLLNNKSIVDTVYPVGSIYMTVNNTSPGTLFSNTTWAKLEDWHPSNASSTVYIWERTG